MQLTSEKPGARWLVLVVAWLVAALLFAAHASAVREYVALLDGLGRPAEETATPLRQVIPARHADAQAWVRHTLDASEHGTWRLRRTESDNAPFGREVHWSSGFAWLLRGAAAIERAPGEPLARALERTLLWFNGPLLFAVVVALSLGVARRAGVGAAVLVACALLGHRRFYEGFAPTYVDHHGLLNAAILGLMLGAACMGAGWWLPRADGAAVALLPRSREAAGGAAVVSAACGALGLWLSAATLLPAIALAGGAALALAWWQGRAAAAAGATFEPGAWRLWGRVGGALSVAFYLLEYAPAHLALRLEVNHPLYALAWWAGAELVALLAEWRVRGATPFRTIAGRAALWTGLALAPAFAIAVGGPSVFLVRDPFVGALRHFVAEGRSLFSAAEQSGVRHVAFELGTLGLLIVAAVLLRSLRGPARLVPAFLALVAAAFAVLGFVELRWWLAASGVQIALLLALVTAAALLAPRARLALIAGVSLLSLVPAVARIATARGENARHAVAGGDLLQPLYRDVAAALRASQPEGDIVLLASPNASGGIGYFGRFKTLGTLYWENAPGLRGAAAIFAARTDEEAAALIRARRVTHVAMLPAANFVGEYLKLLAPHLTRAGQEQTVGFRLLARQSLPNWLQPIPYRPPPESKPASGVVALYRIAFEQTDAERLYQTALAQLAAGEGARGERSLDAAFAAVPPAERAAFGQLAAMAFYDYGADAVAARIFRQTLALRFEPESAAVLAWILATSRDERLRDGPAALALAERAARAEPRDPSAWSSVAAANAELGRFPAAVAAAERALALAPAEHEPQARPLLQRRLEAYRAGRPWRQ